MQVVQFEIRIKAKKEAVWKTLWEDKSFRDWSSNIDEGTYMLGELLEGNEVQFLSSVNGYGVTSLVEKLEEYDYVKFIHGADTQDSGNALRDKEWTGGTETYSLKEENGVTTLTLTTDVPDEMIDLFNERIPKALDRIKVLSELIA
ncbi:MAG TPA: hypothetical protein DCG34_11035 [Clostridiales bacterium]|nr:hypothetical protein [Clostridiales bacterium]